MWRKSTISVVAAFVGGLLAGGCGGSGGPELAEVSGIVTLDGRPLEGAGVVFKREGARHSVGWTDDAGHFELTYLRDIRGAVVGVHTVKVTMADEEAGVPESIPARYNRETTLHRTVESGSNEFEFTLTSK